MYAKGGLTPVHISVKQKASLTTSRNKPFAVDNMPNKRHCWSYGTICKQNWWTCCTGQTLGWFNKRTTGTSVTWQWPTHHKYPHACGQLKTVHIWVFTMHAPSSTDVPILFLNQQIICIIFRPSLNRHSNHFLGQKYNTNFKVSNWHVWYFQNVKLSFFFYLDKHFYIYIPVWEMPCQEEREGLKNKLKQVDYRGVKLFKMCYFKNEGCFQTENLQKEMYLGHSITKESSAILHFRIWWRHVKTKNN